MKYENSVTFCWIEDWGRIFILDVVYISRTFPSDPSLFPREGRNIYTATLLIPDWNISIL